MPDFDLDSALVAPPNTCPNCGQPLDFQQFIGDEQIKVRYDGDVEDGPVSPTCRRACMHCRAPLRLEFVVEWSSLQEERGIPLERCALKECPTCRDMHGGNIDVRWDKRTLILPRVVLTFDCFECQEGWVTRYRPSRYQLIRVARL